MRANIPHENDYIQIMRSNGAVGMYLDICHVRKLPLLCLMPPPEGYNSLTLIPTIVFAIEDGIYRDMAMDGSYRIDSNYVCVHYLKLCINHYSFTTDCVHIKKRQEREFMKNFISLSDGLLSFIEEELKGYNHFPLPKGHEYPDWFDDILTSDLMRYGWYAGYLRRQLDKATDSFRRQEKFELSSLMPHEVGRLALTN